MPFKKLDDVTEQTIILKEHRLLCEQKLQKDKDTDPLQGVEEERCWSAATQAEQTLISEGAHIRHTFL